MTDAEFRNAAVAYLRATSISYPEYQRRVREGVYTPAQVRETNWWKALDALSRIGQSDPPPPNDLAAMARNVVFCAQAADTAMAAPAHYKVALSADPAYAAWATQEMVAQFRSQGRAVYSWCDCRPAPGGTPPEVGLAMRDRLRLDGFVGQAETQAELDAALGVGSGIVVGNPNAWTPAGRFQVAGLVAAGRLAVIAEVYTNEGDPWPDAYSAQGVFVAAFCLGVYAGARGYVTVADYKTHTPAGAWPGVGLYHAAGMRPGEWSLLP